MEGKRDEGSGRLNTAMSIVALPLIWLWNFQIGDYGFWFSDVAYPVGAILFMACWCLFSSVTLLALAFLVLRCGERGICKFLPFISLVLGIIVGCASLMSDLSTNTAFLLAILIGINYGLMLFQWALSFDARGGRSALFVGGSSLIALVPLFYVLSVFRIWEWRYLNFVLVLLVSFLGIALIWGKKRETGLLSSYARSTRSERIRLPVLIFAVLAGFVGSVIVQSSVSVGSGSMAYEYTIGAGVAGILVIFVAKRWQGTKNIKPYFVLFGIVSAVISVSILISMVMQMGSISRGSLAASMVGFWLLFAFLISFLSFRNNEIFFGGDPLFSFAVSLSVFFGAIAITKIFCLAIMPLGQAGLTVSAVLLALSASLAFYASSRGAFGNRDEIAFGEDFYESRCLEISNDRDLTEREKEVMILLAKGNSLNHIADILFLSPNTVKTYRSSLYRKLDIHNRQELINLFSESPNSSL
ncbi:helix-turn-helix transcriptional regulator [Eggerthella lenta]|uniref:helix-turn-helix transcriptional regulator n=1 Tax=Eggerthella lenta TaxID=84112 RepID=UPI00189CC82F|nr:helix-turn-helix transcriptional regulator [Eggerthella lenta]